MADDLKPMLTKLLGSGGTKKFFFAYGVGKRKDGKGDGELAVRGSKPKKADVEEELVGCQEVLEGVCWTGQGPDDGGTVYFQGKGRKLASTIITKMTLTAKRVTGRQYDFQMPSSEEEERAARIGEEQGESDTPTAPPPPEVPSVRTPSMQGFVVRAKALKADVERLQATDPARAAELSKLLVKAAGSAKANDLDAAFVTLDEVEEGLSAPPTPPTPPPPSGMQAFVARAKALKADVERLQATDPARAAELSKLLVKAAGSAKANDFDTAFTALDEVESGLGKRTPPEPPPPPPTNQAEVFKARLKAVVPLYNEATSKAPDSKSELDRLAADAGKAGKDKDFATALDLLDQLEARSKGVLRAAQVKQEIEGAIGKGGVEFQRRMRNWKAAKAKAAVAIGKLKKEILADQDAASLSNWSEIQRGAQALHEVVKDFDELDDELADALEAIDEATSDKDRADAKREALVIVRKYQQNLEDPLHDVIENGAYGNDIKVKSVIAAELNALANALA